MLRFSIASLLASIEADLQQPEVPLSDILREVVELGPAVRSRDYLEWATRELHGYDEEQIPGYRQLHCTRYLIRGMGNGQGVPETMPLYDLPEEIRAGLSPTRPVSQGVYEMESLIAAAQNGMVFLKMRPEQSELLGEALEVWRERRPGYLYLAEAVPVAGLEQILQHVHERLAATVVEQVDTAYVESPPVVERPRAARRRRWPLALAAALSAIGAAAAVIYFVIL